MIGTAAQVAQELGERPGTIRRFVKQGCPCVQRGGRGRGRALLVDSDTVQAWRDADARSQAAMQLAGELPEVLATAISECYQRADESPRYMAGVLAASWYVITSAVLNHLRLSCRDVPELASIPEPIERLSKIAR